MGLGSGFEFGGAGQSAGAGDFGAAFWREGLGAGLAAFAAHLGEEVADGFRGLRGHRRPV
jgi:hypothetical protein